MSQIKRQDKNKRQQPSMRYLISLPNTPATRHSVKYETSSKSFKKKKKSSGKPYCNWKFWNKTWRNHDKCFDIKLSPLGWEPEFPALFIFTSLFSAVRKWHTGARPVASRRVTSRHVTREATQAEREKEKGGRPKKKKEKAHRKTPTTWTFAGEWGDGTGGRHARLVGNTRKHSSGLVKVRSRRRSRAFAANLPRVRVLGGEGGWWG